MIRRRDFITLLGGAAVAWPLATQAQQVGKVVRVGWMSRGNRAMPDPTMDAFCGGMRERGYAEGQSFVIEARYADGKSELMPEQAAELERSGVDVIVAGPFEAAQAAKRSTVRVPIVITPAADPATAGLVDTLDRPGGNITGITEMTPELAPRRLELLKQIVPTLSRAAIMWSPGTLSETTFRQMLVETQATARSLGAGVQVFEASKVDDFDVAFSAMVKEGVDGLIVPVNPMYGLQRNHIIERAMKHKLPAIHEWRGFVQVGALISYGADVMDVYRRAAGLVEKIVNGAKPADLSVERPIKLEMAINLKSAAALGIAIPDTVLRQATAVVQ
jgi:putative ABC transport system substrate-binding protein